MSDSPVVSGPTLVKSLGDLLGAYPAPDDSRLPGPWDPVIQKAALTMRWLWGPGPQPWIAGPQPDPWITATTPGVIAGLNPQPLPPRLSFALALAAELIGRMAGLQDIADALPEQRGAVQDHIARQLGSFIDDCGNGAISARHPS
jgi:hypothetical protein